MSLHVRLAAVLVALGLAGCASMPSGTPAVASPCCTALADLEAQPLGTDGTVEIRLDSRSPRAELPGGVSPVALLRLPEAPRPLALDVTSRQVAGPGSLGSMLLGTMGTATSRAFSPTLTLLDRERRPVRSAGAEGATEGCALLDVAGTRAVLRMHVPITEPATDAAFVLVSTTDAQRAHVSVPCHGDRVEFGDNGRLELRLRPLGWEHGALALSAAATWRPDVARLHLAAEVWHELAGADAGRLMLGERRLVYARDRGAGLVPELTLPLERLVAADWDERSVSVLVRAPGDQALRWHTFALQRPSRPPDGGPTDFGHRLREAVPPDQIVEDIGLAVAAFPEAVGFELHAPARTGGGPLSRVGQDAALAGSITALPCGLCQVGGCGPELLVPCAAAFSVGAVIGGTLSLGRELLTGGLRARPAPAPGPVATDAALGSVGAGRAGLDAPALARCIVDRSRREDGEVWRDQGLTAHLRSLGEGADGAVRHRVEVAVDAITLVATGDVPDAQAPATLRITAHLRMTDSRGREAQRREIAWRGPVRTLGEWSGAPPETIAAELRGACDELGNQMLVAMRGAWRAQRVTAR